MRFKGTHLYIQQDLSTINQAWIPLTTDIEQNITHIFSNENIRSYLKDNYDEVTVEGIKAYAD